MKADTVGGITPAVLVQLRPGEKVLAAHEIMLHMDGEVKLHRKTLKHLGVSTAHLMSMRAKGDSEENYFFAEFEGPGNVTFSRDKAGEVRILQLAPGQAIRLRSGHLICFDETVRYFPMVVARWVVKKGNDQETEYIFADELTGPGTVVFQSHGNILSFNLQPGEAMRTSTEGWLASAPTTQVNVTWFAPRMGGVGVNPRPVLHLVGPGSVMVHSGV
ncbi:MAG: AIM24 family protein [Euryarchaeota archaeon]|nr:AIM24 family protein [Euryarchaeota archaeon]MDE1835572.1 AIM24 family protein [Euryarchaeota archaeon]MDE1878920.1 AIM24 family protein [Euryarchaeota archaeon]MDE2043806.1 AIM24 family protein [Thermoplasmata archaeon]